MADVESRFKKAVWLIRNGPPQASDNETKLNFYKVRLTENAQKTHTERGRPGRQKTGVGEGEAEERRRGGDTERQSQERGRHKGAVAVHKRENKRNSERREK